MLKSTKITAEEALNTLKQGFEVMVKPYGPDEEEEMYTGITIDDFEGDADEEILQYLNEREEIEIWY